jgi:hypothetical protein
MDRGERALSGKGLRLMNARVAVVPIVFLVIVKPF